MVFELGIQELPSTGVENRQDVSQNYGWFGFQKHAYTDTVLLAIF